VKGIPRRKFSLRDVFPMGAFRRGGTGHRRRRSWLRSRPEPSGSTADRNSDRHVSDGNVLDYRTLDGLRLVFSDLYADY
jgi:hypothetical protein